VDDPQGKGRRCFGFTSDDGGWAHCSREEMAGGIKQHKDDTYVHKLTGKCACGTEHGGAEITLISDAARSIVATYDYTNANGALLYQVVRMHPKTFRQRKPDGRGGWTWKLDGLQPVLYRLPEIRAAVAAGDTIVIVEGEKDVEALRAAGHVATCNSGGAGKWRDSFSPDLAGADIVIVRDKDEPGTEHARKVFASVRPHAKSVRVVEARVGKDAADHLAAGHTFGDFVQVWPVADLRASDPVAWKRRALRMSMDATEPLRASEPEAAVARPKAPTWPTGLRGHEPIYALPSLCGVVVAAGVPSTGKSYFAIASAVDAARAGWDVIYLSCEMSDGTIARRILAASGGALPETFHLVTVGYGASVEGLIDWIERSVTERNTLVIFDSVSSFCDQAEKTDTDDPYGTEMLRRLVMWAVNCRGETEGQIAFLLLAEASKEGRVRGRTADHKADLSLLFESDKNNPQSKRITVMKAWESQTGPIGYFVLNHITARLEQL
jgi:5S rRNA maturation endonuclease (ribonuclease M5)